MKTFVLPCLAALLLFGCAGTPSRVDPYATLLPAGKRIVDAPSEKIDRIRLKQEGAVLVVGANFVTYGELWEKWKKYAESTLVTLVGERDLRREGAIQGAPGRTTSIVATALRKHFGSIAVVNDLSEAKVRNAKWIVMFDHSFEYPTTATAKWTNTTAIDLLNGDGLRLVSATFAEDKSYGMALGQNDVMRQQGEDILSSVNSALIQFDSKLAAISQ